MPGGPPLVEQVMLVGQDEKQLGAIVVPRVEAIQAWAAEQGLSLTDLGGSPGEPALLKLLQGEFNRLLAGRHGARADGRLAGVGLVQPFTIDNGLLTQTLKQRRDRITQRDRSVIGASTDAERR